MPQVVCRACGFKLNVPAQLQLTKVACTRCKQPFAAEQAAPAPVLSPAPIPAVNWAKAAPRPIAPPVAASVEKESGEVGMGRGLKIALMATPIAALAAALLFIILNRDSAPSSDTLVAKAETERNADKAANAKEPPDQDPPRPGVDPTKAEKEGKPSATAKAKELPDRDRPRPGGDPSKAKDSPGKASPEPMPLPKKEGDDSLQVVMLHAAPKEIKAAPPKKLRLGVTPPGSDDMGSLLRSMGEGYSHFTPLSDDLNLANRLDEFDIVFLNCGGSGIEARRADLEKWVARGGILYASDLRFSLLQMTFPDYIDPATVGSANPQKVIADVIDSRLQEKLGKTVELRFDAPGWRPAAFRENKSSVLLRGKYRDGGSGSVRKAPLMVRFQHGKGVVLFTSFHNARINTNTAKKLLQTLVFTLVTAAVENEIVAGVGGEGFTLLKHQLYTFDKKEQSLTGPIKCDHNRPLRFALGFRNEGARFRLDIHAPGKKPYSQNFFDTVILEFPEPPTGEWSYTVTALDLPYPNFPFQLTVGQKKE